MQGHIKKSLKIQKPDSSEKDAADQAINEDETRSVKQEFDYKKSDFARQILKEQDKRFQVRKDLLQKLASENQGISQHTSEITYNTKCTATTVKKSDQ